MDHSMTTTAFELDGYRVTRGLGVVRGITVRSRSIFGTLGGSLQTIVGGNITLFARFSSRLEAEAIGYALDQYDIPFLVQSSDIGVFGPGRS